MLVVLVVALGLLALGLLALPVPEYARRLLALGLRRSTELAWAPSPHMPLLGDGARLSWPGSLPRGPVSLVGSTAV